MLRAVAEIDTDAIASNCALLDRASGDAALCAVVKGNGYGHGAVIAARAALRGGARWLGVVASQEAAELRAAGIGDDVPILVLGALSSEELDQALAARADVCAWSLDFADAVAVRGGTRVHVKLDTGMGRLGTRDAGYADAVIERVGTPVGLMTHFATADEVDDPYLDEQLDAFLAWAEPWKARMPALIRHAANSPATLRDPRTHLDLVRCGIAIYGLDPFQGDPLARGLRPAMRLVSYVAAVKRIEPGQSAGYGRRWSPEAPTYTGTIPVGYADGFRRAHTNNGEVLVGGRRVPIVGTVSMDNITVDLGPEPDVAVGDEAVLIGAQGSDRILAEELARRLGTINYEVTAGLTARVTRRAVGAGA
ncbi:MAG TPA: alanine racemase [Solirubrobacteraceae bacterium]|nr:alanine racemase [Solirubrobacteraceae bacterium]